MSDVLIVNLKGDYEGWTATFRRSISAKVLIDLQSGDSERQFYALQRMVLTHNFKDVDGNPSSDILEAPIEALTELMSEWGKAMAELPKAQG
jgi:hypothetical protein